MKKTHGMLMGCLLLGACAGAADTWYWTGATAPWNDSGNWTNATGTAGYPKLGDTAVLGRTTPGAKQAYLASGDNNGAPAYSLREIRFEDACTVSFSQGSLMLLPDGPGLQYLRKASCTANFGGLGLTGAGLFTVNISNNYTYALQRTVTGNTYTGYPVSNPVLVKEGNGKFVFFNEGGGRTIAAKTILIRRGGIDITSTSVLQGNAIGFDGNDPNTYLSFDYGGRATGLQLKDGGLFETNGVANTTHYITSSQDTQVILSGTPRFATQVFSGQLKGKAGLAFRPSSSDYAFVFSNAVSATTGRLAVEKGTMRLGGTASFTALSALTVGAGARFEVAEGAGAAFKAGTLAIGDGTSRLVLGADVALDIGAGTISGGSLSRGTYAASESEAEDVTKVAWIEGPGRLTVSEGPDAAGTWKGGAAGGTSVALADNWETTDTIDLSSGTFFATFAAAGTEATLPANATAKFMGLSFASSALSSFTLAAGEGAVAEIGASGLNSAEADATRTWNIGWPLALTAAQEWVAATNNVLNVNGGFSGSEALVMKGPGRVNFNSPSTHTGSISLQSGSVMATATNAFGAAGTVSWPHDTMELVFDGEMALATPFSSTHTAEFPSKSCFTVKQGSHVTFEGKVSYKADALMTFETGSVTTFRNGLTAYIEGMQGFLLPRGAGTVAFYNTPLSLSGALEGAGAHPIAWEFHVAGNKMADFSRYWAYVPAGRITAFVANALAEGTCLRLEKGTLDLGGFDQKMDLFSASSTACVTSAVPATLTVRCTKADTNNARGIFGDHSDTNRVNAATFAGFAGLRKQGGYPFALSAVSPSVGTLAVEGGILRLTSAARWPNATNVSVSAGATLKVENANAFGDADRAAHAKPLVHWQTAAAGTAQLDFSGTVRCATLRVDGAKVYGVFGALGSGAPVEVAWITGTGRLRADATGTTLIVR